MSKGGLVLVGRKKKKVLGASAPEKGSLENLETRRGDGGV